MATKYSSVSDFNYKWGQVSAAAQKQGIAPAQIRTIYNMDLQRLNTPGDYPMSQGETWAALQSAHAGQPLTPTAQQGYNAGQEGSYLGNDVKDFGVGLLGLVKSVIGDVAHPEHIGSQVSALWRDPRVIIDPLKALTNLDHNDALWTAGQSPLLSALVPGLADASKFVTKDGHFANGFTNMAEHPFTSVADLLPGADVGARIGSATARAGLNDAERATLDAAGKYKPSDLSNQARLARSEARKVIPSAITRAYAVNPGGLFGLISHTMFDAPWHDETVGTVIARKLSSGTGGAVGSIPAAVGRMFSTGDRGMKHDLAQVVDGGIKGFYDRHQLNDTKNKTAFTYALHHYGQDWAKAQGLDPLQAEKIQRAVDEYSTYVTEYSNTDLARSRLGTVTDPRTNKTDIYGTEGEDAKVLSAQKTYLKASRDAGDVTAELSDLAGTLIPKTKTKEAIGSHAAKIIAPLQRFTQTDPKDELGLRNLFAPNRPVGAEKVDPSDPEAVRAMLERGRTMNWRRSEYIQVGRLFGPTGRFHYLGLYISSGHLDLAEKSLTAIIRTMKTKLAQSNPEIRAQTPHLEQLQKLLGTWNKSGTQSKLVDYQRKLDAFTKKIDSRPAAKFQPRMNELVNERLLQSLHGSAVTPEDYDLVLARIVDGSWQGKKFSDIVDKKEILAIRNSALKALKEERDQGLDPKFTYSVSLHEVGGVGKHQMTFDRVSRSRSSKSRGLVSPGAIHDPIIGLVRKAEEDIHEQHVTELLLGDHGVVSRWGVTSDDAYAEAMQFAKDPQEGSMLSTGHMRADYVEKNYKSFNPMDFFAFKNPKIQALSGRDDILIPREVHQAIERTIRARNPASNPASRAFEGGTRIFRYSLLNFSPRYQAHIWLAGGMLLLGRSGPVAMSSTLAAGLAMSLTDQAEILKFMSDKTMSAPLRPVWDWMKRSAEKRGETAGLPVSISHGAGEFDPQDQVRAVQYGTGQKMGKWYEFMAKHRGVLHAGTEIAEIGANMLRAQAYLIGKAKGGEEAGQAFALKVFADMDAMTPLERSIIRYAMPFYGWTKHIVQYTATLPIDHPFRVQVLSQLVNQEWNDWNTGIPKSFMYLFQIGATKPDGSATVVDLRNVDPLRSASDIFTKAGFLSALNPAFQSVASSVLGINPQSGGPADLYPTLTINAFTNAVQPTSVKISTVIENGLGGYIPEASVIDHFAKLSSYTRWAATNSPSSYQQQLYSALNFPWVPQKVNLDQLVAKTEIARYGVATKDAAAALASADPHSDLWNNLISNYTYVPYSGWMVQPRELRKWAFDQVYKAGYWNGQAATLPPSAIIVPPSKPKL